MEVLADKEKASALGARQYNNDKGDADETMSTCSLGSSLEDDDLATVRIPKGFLCPLTMEIMYDPVLDAEGNTYERVALLEWLTKEHTSPISRQPLSEQMLNPNNALRDAIHEFMGDKWVQARAMEYSPYEKTQHYSRSKSKCRDKINCFLQLISCEFRGLPSSLSEKGCCAFRHDGITMALDVPESIGVFCVYTRGLVPELTEPMKDLLLELNFLQGKWSFRYPKIVTQMIPILTDHPGIFVFVRS